MNEGTLRSLTLHRGTLQPRSSSKIWFRTACLLLVVLLPLYGCTRNQSSDAPRTQASPAEQHAQTTPPPPITTTPVQPREVNEAAKIESPSLEGSGKTAWAKGFEGKFIGGLDGGLYEPYHAGTIERVQQALKDRGLYVGPINGILDPPTMKAIYTLQEATHNLQMCGIPTPHTRKLLRQGSHTDVTS